MTVREQERGGGSGGREGRRGDRREGGREGRREGGREGRRDGDREGRQELPPQSPEEQARAICLRLLTGMPRTRRQLADALEKRGIPEEVSQEVLSRYEEVGLIDDAAFAGAWVESRHRGRGLARRALAQELRTKGVHATLVQEALEQLDSDQEEQTARELVERKLRSTRGLERDKRIRRLAGMLARKGYPEGMALRVVRRALEQEGAEGADEDADGLGYAGF
ncbi:recombination regulator RecX [Streptomyces flavotricini]|uniref:Regulatory protein RecX n=1 Tax=Streptomyces flavotricini TaxID=66888 RepID=A0ABS8E319_9ACTN|nr:recombination regulator RecX [Streptomyces flavotricini]MCC0095546.1 recombination regulator RecX [Streptomyces flavotricini]